MSVSLCHSLIFFFKGLYVTVTTSDFQTAFHLRTHTYRRTYFSRTCEKHIKKQKVILHILLQKQNLCNDSFHWKLCLQKYNRTNNCYCFPMVWVTGCFFLPERHNKSFPEFLPREKRNCLHFINFSTLFLSTLCHSADSSLLTAHLGVLHFPAADNSYQHVICSDAVINKANIKWFRIRQPHP